MPIKQSENYEHPNTMDDHYILIHSDYTHKNNSKSVIIFDIFKDKENKIFIRMIKKGEIGTLSDEMIPLSLIFESLKPYAGTNTSISAQPLKGCFSKYKQNSPAFLAAILRKLELLKPSNDNKNRHIVQDYSKWEAFANKMLECQPIELEK